MKRYPRVLFVLLSISMGLLPPVPVVRTAGAQGQAAGEGQQVQAAIDLNPNVGVDPETGGMVFHREDLAPLGPEPTLSFARTWRSREAIRGVFGAGWVHNWEQRVEALADGSMVWWTGEGRPIVLAAVEGGTWQSTRGEFAVLEKTTGAWLLTGADQVLRSFHGETGRLVAVQSPAGRRVSLNYEDGLLASVQDEVGRSLRFEYVSGRLSGVAGVVGPGNAEWSLSVQFPQRGTAGQAATVTCAGLTETYTYDDSGDLLEVGVPGQVGLRVEYDRQGRAMSLSGPSVTARRFDYGVDDDGVRETRVEVAGAGTTAYRYLPDGREEVIDPLGQKVELTRDARGSIDSVLIPGSGRFALRYDERGNLLGASNPLGQKVAIEYDAANRPVRLTDARGKVSSFAYDARGNLVRMGRADGTEMKIAYNVHGRAETITDPMGAVWRYGYDEFGNIATIVDPAGGEFRYRYDGMGRLLEARTPTGAQLGYTYDANGRLASLGEGERAVRFEYDGAGQLAAIASPTGERVVVGRGARGRITEVRNPLGGTATLGYDDLGRLASATTAAGLTHKYGYDVLGRIKQVTDPAGAVSTYEYNPLGLVSAVTNRDGHKTDFEYDAIGRLTRMHLGEGDEVRIAYDANGNPTQLSDKDSQLLLDYDGVGRLTRTRDEILDVEIRREYDGAGRLTALVTPWGKVQYGYDASGRMVSVAPPVGDAIRIERNGDGLTSALVYPNGQVTRFDRDTGGRLLSAVTSPKRGEPKLIQSVEYDRSGYPTAEERDGERRVYKYDDAGHLLSNGKGVSFRRDASGRPLVETRAGQENGDQEIVFEWDQAGRVARRGETRFEHDARGRLVRRVRPEGEDSYGWNELDQLTSATLADGTNISWRYDPMGRKEARTVGDQEVRFLNVDSQRLAALNGSGEPMALYVNGPELDQPLAVVAKDGNVLYLHPDADGDVVAVTDQDGRIINRFDYDPFGRPLADVPQGDLIPFGYRGRPWEAGLGWWDMRARHLDPELGLFTSEDPMGLTGSGDLYSYAAYNPKVLSDPSGAIPVPLITGAVGAVLGAATYAVPRLWDQAHGKDVEWNAGDLIARTAGGFVAGAAAPLLVAGLGGPAAIAAGSMVKAGAIYFASGALAEVGGMLTEDVLGHLIGSAKDWFRDPMEYVAGAAVGGTFGVAFAPFSPLGKALGNLKVFGRGMGGRKPSSSRMYDLALKWGRANAGNLGVQQTIKSTLKKLAKFGVGELFGFGDHDPVGGQGLGHGGPGDPDAAILGRDVDGWIQQLDGAMAQGGTADLDTPYEQLQTAMQELSRGIQERRSQLVLQERMLRDMLDDADLDATAKADLQAQLDGIVIEREDLDRLEAEVLARAEQAAQAAEATGEVGGPTPQVQPR